MSDRVKKNIADSFAIVGGLIILTLVLALVGWFVWTGVCGLYCWIMPPKIYGLCGVSLGEKWNGESHPFMDSTAPEVSRLADSEIVYKIEIGVVGADLNEVVGLVKEKYGITPTVRQFTDSKEEYQYFRDNCSNRAILVWPGTVCESKYEIGANGLDKSVVVKGKGVCIRAIDYSLEAKVEEELRRNKMRGL